MYVFVLLKTCGLCMLRCWYRGVYICFRVVENVESMWGYVCFRVVGNVGFMYVFVLVVTWGLCVFSCWW